jgi:hypothetical protein
LSLCLFAIEDFTVVNDIELETPIDSGADVVIFGFSMPKEFYIPLGKLRIGRTTGFGANGTVKVGGSM